MVGLWHRAGWLGATAIALVAVACGPAPSSPAPTPAYIRVTNSPTIPSPNLRAMSENGGEVAYLSGGDVYAWNRTTRVTRQITADGAQTFNPIVSGDGSTVVFPKTTADSTLGAMTVSSAATGASTTIATGDLGTSGPQVSRDGGRVLFYSNSDDVVAGHPSEYGDIYEWNDGTLSAVTHAGGSLAPDPDPANPGGYLSTVTSYTGVYGLSGSGRYVEYFRNVIVSKLDSTVLHTISSTFTVSLVQEDLTTSTTTDIVTIDEPNGGPYVSPPDVLATADNGDVVAANLDGPTYVSTIRWTKATATTSIVLDSSDGVLFAWGTSTDGRYLSFVVGPTPSGPLTGFAPGSVVVRDTSTGTYRKIADPGGTSPFDLSLTGRYVLVLSVSNLDGAITDINGADPDLFLWDRGS